VGGLAALDALSVSVLITYYGERELLRECLESLSRQTRIPHEILVYDDASDAPAERYVPAGMNVRVLHGRSNRGPAFGRNQLLGASTGAYVHFHDADDLFHPEWHARVCAAIEETRPDVVLTEIDAHTAAGLRSPRVLALDKLAAGADLVRFCIQGVMLVPSGTYRRDAVQAIGGYRVSQWQAEDFDFHVRLAATRPSYAIITDPLVTIRVRTDGRSHDSVQTWCLFVDAVSTLAQELPRSYRWDFADAAARAGSTLFKLGARDQARAAFRLADRLGPPRFTNQPRLYRLLARTLGFEAAEHIAGMYRTLLPAPVRAAIRPR
jgi:glycosyltransferase involved in cell wall biosynthesis